MSDDPEIAEILSRDRLDGYAIKNGPNEDRNLLGRYLYNLAVSHALYPHFHTLEVVLRNRIHSAVSAGRPVDPDRPDLYDKFPCWLDERASILTADHRLVVADAKKGVLNDLRRRHGAWAPDAKRFRTPGRLVAKLPFSFWVFLFDADYVGNRGEQGALWPRYFKQVFPYWNGAGSVAGTIHVIRQRLRHLHVVRNRLMHHERIAPWEDRNGALNPAKLRSEIEEMLAWMAPRSLAALQSHGPWDDVFSPEFERLMQWIALRI